MTHDLCSRSLIPTPFPTPSLILLMPQICASLHRQPASIPPNPPNPHAGPGADFWTHLHELVLSLLPLAQPLRLLLHFSLGSAAHQDWCAGPDPHQRTADMRRLGVAGRVSSHHHATITITALSFYLSRCRGGGAKGLTHRPTLQLLPHPAPAGTWVLPGDLRPSLYLVSYVCLTLLPPSTLRSEHLCLAQVGIRTPRFQTPGLWSLKSGKTKEGCWRQRQIGV